MNNQENYQSKRNRFYEGCQLIIKSKVESTDESSSSSVSEQKKFFWVTRYSLGKTLSRELLIEHEFANDQSRHRLVELHTLRNDEKKHHFLLAIIALVLHPPIGLIACILAWMAKRQSQRSINFEDMADERAAARYAFISYLFSLISIGLTIGLIIAVLLYFFIRDLNMNNRNFSNMNQYKTMPSLSYRTLLKNVPFEKIEKYS